MFLEKESEINRRGMCPSTTVKDVLNDHRVNPRRQIKSLNNRTKSCLSYLQSSVKMIAVGKRKANNSRTLIRSSSAFSLFFVSSEGIWIRRKQLILMDASSFSMSHALSRPFCAWSAYIIYHLRENE